MGGSVSLAVGLHHPEPLGSVISQRGILMQQTRDDLMQRSAMKLRGRRVLMTAGNNDNTFLLGNQEDAHAWLRGCHAMWILRSSTWTTMIAALIASSQSVM